MNDIVPGDYSTKTLAKQGVAAAAGIIGGVLLFAMGALPAVPGIITGAVIGLVGLANLKSREAADRTGGAIAIAAGALTILSKVGFLKGLAGGLLGLGAFGLLGLGVWNAIKFFTGLKHRS